MTYNPFSLSGKTVLITGAASGIGRATAIECCRMGAEVIITDINPDGLEETFRQLPEQNGTHIRIVADLTNRSDDAYPQSDKKEENEESFIHCFYSLCRRSIQGIRRQRYLCHDQMRNRCLYENNCVGIRR